MGSINRIDSVYDVAAIAAEQEAVEKLVRASIEQIKNARTQSIDLNANTKGFEEYSKKAKELEKSLVGMAKANDAATRSSILLSKQKEAEAKAAERVAKQALAETRAREANQKAAEKEAAAVEKANKAKDNLSNRPIGSIPSEIKTGDTANPDASNERVNQLEREQAALDSAAAAEGNYGAAKLKSTQASGQTAKSISDELTPLQQNIVLRENLKNKIADITKTQKDNNALLKSGGITQQEYNKRLVESQTRVAVYKTRVQELTRVIKEDIALEGRAGDAYKQLSAEYNKAALAAKNYQVELGKNHPTTIAAVANAKKLSNELKEVDAAVGQNQRNVGNYTKGIVGAFKSMFGFLRTAANIIPGLGISGLLLALSTPIIEFTKQLFASGKAFDEVARNRKIYNEVQQESIKGAANELVSIDGLVAAARNENASREDRNKAIKILQDQYPAYLKNISLETINSEEAQKAIDKLKDAVLQKAVADAYAAKIAAAVIKNAEIKTKLDKQELFDLNNRIAFRNKLTTAEAAGDQATIRALKRYGLANDNIEKTLHKTNEELSQSNSEIDFLKKGYDAAILATLDFTKVTEIKDKKSKKGRDLAEANRRAEFEILKNSIQLDIDYQKERLNNEKLSFEDRLTALVAYTNRSQQLLDVTAQFELATASKTRTEKLKIESDKDAALIRLARETSKELQKIIEGDFNTDTSKLPIDPKIPKELQKIIDDFDKAQKKAIKDAADNAKKLKEAFKEAFVSLASELEDLFFDIFVNQIEVQKNAVQDQIDLLDKQKQKDIEVANQTITNAQEKADAIAVIEARAAAKKQQLELKQRQLDQQKARFEKARAVVDIIQNTSLAVVKALAQFPGPAGIALAAVIGALGAVQLARVLAQPIPRYAEGTENHPGGLAVVGDGGKSETVVLPDGSLYRTPSKDTIVNLPAGTKVIPDYQGKPQSVSVMQPVDTTDEIRAMRFDVVKAIKKIPQPIIYAERAWTQAHKTGSNYRNYLNRSI